MDLHRAHEAVAMDVNGLSGHKYLSLETYRKNGEAVRTPVWFAEDPEQGAMYVRTFSKTGKVRRLRREPLARIAPCDARGDTVGEWVDVEASIVAPGTADDKRANALLNEKYGLTKRLVEPLFGLRYGTIVTVSISASAGT